MICEVCGIEAPTKYVDFHQNIGALVMRFSKSIKGNLCKSCIHKHYWSFTGTNAVLGWWGLISLIVTPVFILNNTVRYLLCLGMEAPAPGARSPELTDEVVDRIQPFANSIFDRLNNGDSLDRVANDVALSAHVSPGQVFLYVRAVVQHLQEQQQK